MPPVKSGQINITLYNKSIKKSCCRHYRIWYIIKINKRTDRKVQDTIRSSVAECLIYIASVGEDERLHNKARR